ncbi:MAG: SHOCT domain-containing protein [Proteobacteria bacterium]|nr:SHOCT domain-containing protein [Pseudomonadota bacterium]
MAIANRMSAAAVALAAAFPMIADAHEGAEGVYRHGHMWGSGWGMAIGPLLMILALGALVVMVIFIVRSITGRAGHMGHDAARQGALKILEERFARGEIDEKEFTERRRLLSD